MLLNDVKELKVRAVVQSSAKQYSEAKKSMEEALSILIGMYGPNHDECIKIKGSIQDLDGKIAPDASSSSSKRISNRPR